ncbi:MAG: ATPase V [Bacteroidales bacterium]|nr:ATPase V [Bacteroidales bacterium]
MIEKMTRYDFILLSRDTDAFLGRLQELGVVDITRSVKAVDEKSAAMIADIDSLRTRMAWLEKEDFSKDERYASLLSSIASCEKEREDLSHWGAFDPAAVQDLASKGCTIHFYCLSRKKFDPAWEEQYPLELISEDASRIWFVIVTTDPEAELPSGECEAPQISATQCDERLSSLRGELAARGAELMAEKATLPQMRSRYEALLSNLDIYLAGVAVQKAAEDTLTVVTGFAPSDQDESLRAEFNAMDLYYVSERAVVEDQPPIKLRNNRFVRMFEVLTDMYGRPAYDGFDPTPFISIFFLLFFAMCMGDAGYGLVLMVVGLLLRKVKSFKSLAPLVVTLGAGTVVIGLLFHTFFSIDISGWEIIPDALKKIMVPAKVSTYDGTMVLALIVGIVHLCLAMIVKTVYATKNKGFLGSLSTWGWTLLIVGGVCVGAVSLMGVIDAEATRIAIIVIGLLSALGIFLLNNLHRNPLINIGSGLWETYNTATGILGDVLSYLRLYALGLAGSMLGYAFNNLATMALGDGGARWIAFILIVLVGHTLNIAMAALGAFVHPLRLNFLEFFKNSGYEGSGRNYHPLKKLVNN